MNKKVNLNTVVFFLKVFRNTFRNFFVFINHLGFLKIIKLLITAFTFIQIFIFYQKFFILQNFNLEVSDYVKLFCILIVFPVFFSFEKFFSQSFLGSIDSNIEQRRFWADFKESFLVNIWPHKSWAVYFLSQSKLAIDIIGLFSIFIFGYIFYFYDYQNISLLGSLKIVLYLVLYILAIYICLLLWRVSSFLFMFWKGKNTFLVSLKKSYDFSKSKRLSLLLKYIIFRAFEVFIIALFVLLLYAFTVPLFSFLSSYLSTFYSFIFVLLILLFLGLIFYFFLLVLGFAFWDRVFTFISGEKRPKTKTLEIKYIKQIFIINYLGVFIVLAFSLIYFINIFRAFTLNQNTFTDSNIDFQKIIKISNDGKIENNANEYVQKYINKGTNGIAISLDVSGEDLRVKPLYTRNPNIFSDISSSIAPVFTFNLYQNSRSLSTDNNFQNIYNTANANKYLLFVYIKSGGEINEKLLVDTFKNTESFYLIVFSDDNQVLQILKNNFPNLRTGLLAQSADVKDYEYKTFFTFNESLSNINLKKLKNKNINTYVILKEGEAVEASLNNQFINGVLTDITVENYQKVRSISEEDIYKSILTEPLKFLGF